MPDTIANMKRWKKIITWSGFLIALFLVLLVALDIIAPKIINLESLKEKIRAYASRELGIEVDFSRIEPSLFPRPGIVLDDAIFRIPGKLEGAVRQVTVKAKLLPLITGRIVLEDLYVDRPAITLNMKMQKGEAKDKGEKIPISGINDLMRTILLILSHEHEMKISEGKLTIVRDERPVLEFAPLNAEMASRGNEIEMDIRATSNIIQSIEIGMRIDSGKQSAAGQMNLKQIELGKIAELFSPASTEHFGDRRANLQFGLNITEHKFVFTGVEGDAGRISFSGIEGQIDLRDDAPLLKCSAGTLNISLDELLERLAPLESVPGALKDIQSAAGTAKLMIRKIEGPLFTPSAWGFDASAELRNVTVESTQLPGPLMIKTGTLSAVPDRITFSNLRLEMIDTSLEVSGSATKYRRKDRTASIATRGTVGSRTHRWINARTGLPPRFHTEYPLIIRTAKMDWKGGSDITVTADIAVPEGPEVGLVLGHKNGEWDIKKLSVKDAHSDAVFSTRIGKEDISLTFAGVLSRGTVSRLVFPGAEKEGWLRGEIAVHVPRERVSALTATGEIAGGKIHIPWDFEAPLEIVEVHINAREREMFIESSTVTAGDISFSVRGSLGYRDDRYVINADFETERVIWETIEAGVKKKGSSEKDGAESLQRGFPITGDVNVKMGSFVYKGLTWEPLHLAISLDQGTIAVTTTEAVLCNISTPVRVSINNDIIDLNVGAAAKDQDLQSTLKCLHGKDTDVTGTFEFKGDINGKGTRDDLLLSLHGPAEFSAKKGKIFRHSLFTRIFQLINVTEVFSGKYEDIVREGFAYNSLVVKGQFNEGKLVVDEMVLDGSTMEMVGSGTVDVAKNKMDLTIIVAPLKTVDRIVKMIPILRNITRGTLITIAMKVKGPIADPDVTVLPAAAVGEGLVGMMKRVFKLPVQLLSPDDANTDNEKSD